MCNQNLSHAVGFRSTAISHFVIGSFCIFWQIGILVCATAQDGLYYIFARATEFGAFQYAARNMALSSMGIFAGLCYIVIGILAYRLSQSMRPGAPPAAVSRQPQLFKIFRAQCILGIVVSMLLFSFSVYLAYMMAFYWELYIVNPLIPYNYYSQLSNVLSPTILHSMHAILSFAQIFTCIRGARASYCAPQVTSSTTYQIQYPAQPAYVIQQQAYPQPYPAGQQQYPVPHQAGQNFGK